LPLTRAADVDCAQSEFVSLQPISPLRSACICLCAHWASREASYDIL
jgi:hypothetical protein